jgi:hypothetical protein
MKSSRRFFFAWGGLAGAGMIVWLTLLSKSAPPLLCMIIIARQNQIV